MLYAIDGDGEKVPAAPGAHGACPECLTAVQPKCGEIKIWHWAHKPRATCTYSDGETDWHLSWKKLVVPAACEVKIGNHRADIVGNKGIVIELQASPIDPGTIAERERHYGEMLWVFNAFPFAANVDLREKGDFLSFRWKWPRLSMSHCEAPIFWDFGIWPRQPRAMVKAAPEPKRVEMLRVKKLGNETPCGGWGTRLTKQGFIWKYLSDWLPGKAVVSSKAERREMDDISQILIAALEEEERAKAG